LFPTLLSCFAMQYQADIAYGPDFTAHCHSHAIEAASIVVGARDTLKTGIKIRLIGMPEAVLYRVWIQRLEDRINRRSNHQRKTDSE